MAERKDPGPQFNFVVEIDGVAMAGFMEVSGLESRIDVIEYREGDEKGPERKLPGKVTFSNVVLKVGIAGDKSLYDWHREWLTGAATAKRKNVRVVLLDRARNEIRAWLIHNAWPAKWEGPTLNATGTDVAVETFELAHEGIETQ